MRKRNNSVISKPFAVFVVIGIGIALTAYVVIGIVSIEIKAHRMNQERVVAKRLSDESVSVEGWLQNSSGLKIENERRIESVEGEVLSFKNGVVTIASDLGGDELTEVRLLVNEGDEDLLEVGANVTAILSDEILVSDLEDGAIGAEKFAIVDEKEGERAE